MPQSSSESQNVQVQSALFHIESLLVPANPKYQLNGKIRGKRLIEFDVLDPSSASVISIWHDRREVAPVLRELATHIDRQSCRDALAASNR